MTLATAPDPGEEANDVAADFAEISRALYSAPTVKETLERAVAFSVRTIGGCSGAAISFLQADEIVTSVWTEPKVLEIDMMQYSTGQGPCLDAITQGTSSYSDDLLTDRRWPLFGAMAAEAGMRSLLSFCLVGAAKLGALNLYAPLPGAFPATERAKGLIFATHAALALASATEIEGASQALAVEIEKLQNLYGALASRQVIGRAEGILMQRHLITGEQAFALLCRASQDLNTKLRDVAQYVVENGLVPQTPDRFQR